MNSVCVLAQKTRFCGFALEKVKKRFNGRVLCERFDSIEEGKALCAGLPKGARVMLLWGSGESHHLSNILNIPGSLKHVFDNHPDSLVSMRLGCDTHNYVSRMQGVLLRVCRSIKPCSFFEHDPGEGNGLLHVSVDLDFIKGFPALPWLSKGSNETTALAEEIRRLGSKQRVARFDIGGFHEIGEPGEKEMQAVYETFYDPLLSVALAE